MKSEKETKTQKKLPYSPPRIVRVRLDPDGAVLACGKTAAGHGVSRPGHGVPQQCVVVSTIKNS